MGYDLHHWALTEPHPCLTPRTRQVLAAICLVAHDDHGEFWMRGRRLIAEYMPDLSYAAYKNHLSILVRNGLLIKLSSGGGRTSGGRGTSNVYQVNSPLVTPQQPAQGVLPEIARSPEAAPPEPEVEEDQPVDAGAAHRRLDEMLSAGISPEQVIAILNFTAGTLLEPSDSPANDAETGKPDLGTGKPSLPDSEKQVSSPYRYGQNRSGDVARFGEETGEKSDKQVSSAYPYERNRSGQLTPHQYTEEKRGEEKEDHAAAAANRSDGSGDGPDFFEVLTQKVAAAGHRGIRAAQFEHLRELAPRYAEATGGTLPDEHTAEYIVGRLKANKDVRNVAGFVLAITEDVLRTGEGYEEPEPAPDPACSPPPAPPEPAPALDWELLHLAHIEQVAPAQDIWGRALEKLRPQLPRPAFETQLAESSGWAYTVGKFVVCTPNAFIKEMLLNRLDPLIERAIRDVTGSVLAICYAIEPREDTECPGCLPDAAKAVSAS